MDLFTLTGKILLDSDGFSEKIDTVMSKVESLGNGLQKAGEKISGVGSSLTKAVTVPLTALGTAAVSTASTFEDGMLKVQSLSGATQEEYKKLSGAAKQYGSTTAWTAKDVADAMGYMALAGFDTNEILKSTSGMLSLASASGEDLATVTDILTDSMTAFGDGADEASRYADVLATTQAKSNTTVGLLGEAFKYAAPLAGSYGYKLEDVATALGQMANAGVKGSMAGTALSSIITRLGTDTDGCRTAIEEMGISFYNQDGTARDLSTVLKDLCDKTQSLSVEQKASVAKHIAGMEAQKGLLAILNQGSAAYSDLESQIKSCSGAASDMAENMESGLGGSIRSLKSALEGVAITLGEKLAPYVTKAADKIKEFTTWFQSLDEKTQNNIIRLGLFAAAAGPVITIFGKGVTVIGTLITTGSRLAGGIGNIISAGKILFSGGTRIVMGIGSLTAKIGGGLLPALASVPAPVWIVIAAVGALVAAGVALYKNWDEISAWAGKTWESVKETVGNAIDSVTGFFGRCRDSCHEMVDGIKQKVSEMKEEIVSRYHEIKEGAEEKFADMKENAVARFTEMKEKASEKVEELRAQAGEKIQNLRDSVETNFRELCEKGSAKVAELKDKVVTGFHNLKEEAGEKISDLKEKWGQRFEEAREKIVSEVTELKEKSAERIKEFKESAVSRIIEFKENAVGGFHEFKTESAASLQEVAKKGVEGFNNIKEKGSAAIENLKNTTGTRFSEMGNAIYEKFSGIGDKIVGTFAKCRESIHGIVEKIRGFFDFEWKLPHIKLPHFSIDGEFSLSPPSIPHLGVEWYAKAMDQPMIMTKPTAFGISPSGQIMAGGEAGSEVVSGTNTLMHMISAAVAENNSIVYGAMEKMYGLLLQYLPELANRQMILDTGTLVGELAQPLNDELGWIAHTRGRRN